jgi:cytochrome c oxidase subunit II
MMKRIGTVAACAVLAFTLAACGGNNGNNAANEPAASNDAAANNGAAAGNVVNLTATNYKFDQEVYKVKAGEVTFNLNNAEGIHGVKISNTDVKLNNDTTTQTVTLDNPGEYVIECSIPCGPGHVKMKAKLVVEA